MELINPLVRRWLEDGLADPDEFWARAARELRWRRVLAKDECRADQGEPGR